jgi:hypothetical protein
MFDCLLEENTGARPFFWDSLMPGLAPCVGLSYFQRMTAIERQRLSFSA